MSKTRIIGPLIDRLRRLGRTPLLKDAKVCEGTYFDSVAGLDMKTWCGGMVEDTPQPICEVDGRRDTRHFVYIRNCKTHQRVVVVRGILLKNNAKFEAGSSYVSSETEWNRQTTIYAKYGLTEDIFGEILIGKKRSGDEVVKVEVEYQDHWNPSIINRADADMLIFGIDVT